jgi:predicted secreted protein
MSWISIAAIYFVIWWIVLFAVLPFGVKNVAETGAVVGEGHDPGAPVLPQLARKAVITTVASALLLALGWWLAQSGLVDFDALPLFRDLPKPR